MALNDPVADSCGHLAKALRRWSSPGASDFERATYQNLREEARVDHLREAFHEAVDKALGRPMTPSAGRDAIRWAWDEMHALAPSLGFALPYRAAPATPDDDTITYVPLVTLFNSEYGYLDAEEAAARRQQGDPPPIHLRHPYGTPNPEDPAALGLRRVWLSFTEATRDLEHDVDHLLDCLGKTRGPGRWWSIAFPVADCPALSVPTAIDSAPPFAPAPPGSPTGRTVSLGSRRLPELISRPADLPEKQMAKCIGAGRTVRAEAEFLRKRLAGP